MHALLDSVLIGGGASPEVLNVDDDGPGGRPGALPALDADVVVFGETANYYVGGGIPWRGITQSYA